MIKVAVIGGGWYGCYCALRLRKEGYYVILYEAKAELFRGVSKNYGNRLHSGPHYQRSAVTRKECQLSSSRFQKELPGLVKNHKEAIYCLGKKDCDGLPPRVDWETFQDVCQECDIFGKVTSVNCETEGYANVFGGFKIVEPSTYLDEPRHYFTDELHKHGVIVKLNHKVIEVISDDDDDGMIVDGLFYNFVVNCTYYKEFTSQQPIPLEREVFYQPSLTLLYAQQETFTKEHHPFSFTIMDGWFPSIMPKLFNRGNPNGETREAYILYHAKHSLLGACNTHEESEHILNSITDEWVMKEFKPKMEESIKMFYPIFDKEFEYIGWNSETSTKIRSTTEFRSPLVWSEKNMIHVLSAKVTTIHQAGDDVISLIKKGTLKLTNTVERASYELRDDKLENYNGSGSIQAVF